MAIKNQIFTTIFLLLSITALSQAPVTDSLISMDGKIFDKVEKEAVYPGGATAWRNYLEKTANGAVASENGAPAGMYTVMVQFVVDKEGRTSEIKPLTNFGYGMEQEVVRLIKLSGLWEPAFQNQRNVKAYRKQPVTFIVLEDGFTINSETPYVLYTNTDNAITVTVDKVKNTDLQLTMTGGSIKSTGDGNFIVNVKKPGRVIIRLYNTKKNKEIGAASFEVQDVK